ncbi:MAG TPA: serine hydrolase domain-containing protein [Stenotrophomonas sp.]
MTKRDSEVFLMRRRDLLAAGLAAFVLPSFAKGTDARTSARARDFDAYVIGEMRRANIPGLAVGSARQGVVRLVKGYGYADIGKARAVTPQTLFHLASVTKTVTATAIMQLAEEGRFHLDEPVAPHLDFPLRNPHHPDTPITFRQLLMHTSSLSDEKYYEVDFREKGRDAEMSLTDFLRGYLLPDGANYSKEKCFSAAAPGSTWDYSNVGYGLLGYLAGRIGKQDMRDQTHARIFAPLAMRDTHWTLRDTPASSTATPYDIVDGVLTPVEPVGFPDWPVGMLRSSMADFIRFVAASANGGTAQGHRILKSQTMAQVIDMQKPGGLPAWLTGQGLGWMGSPLNGTNLPNHWGGDPGVFTAVYIDPAKQAGVGIFSNATTSTEGREVIKSIASRLLDDDFHD